MDDTFDFDDTITLQATNYCDKEEYLLETLNNKTAISSIVLNQCNLSLEQLANLLNHIKDPSYLFEIDVSCNKLGPSVISSIFRPNICPSTLILDEIKLGDAGLISLAKSIENIRILSVASNGITSRGVIVFFSTIDVELTSLNLSQNQINDSCVYSMKNNIKKLNISGNSFTTTGLSALCEKFSMNDSSIKSFNMSDMNFVKVPSNNLLSLLKSKSLRSLYLRNCHIPYFPDVPEDTHLKIIDLTANESLAAFSYPQSLTIIGDIMLNQKIKLNLSGFDKVFELVDEIKRTTNNVSDETGEISKLLERINRRTNDLYSFLLTLKKKVKPSVRSLSKYASKINASDDLLHPSFGMHENQIEGYAVSSTLSLSMKMNIFSQFLMMYCDLNEKNQYFKENFELENSFLITRENKLRIKDKTLIVKQKPNQSSIEFFSFQLFGYYHNEFISNFGLSRSLISSMPIKISNPPCYTVERSEKSLIELFSKLNNVEILTRFQLKCKGESAVDHGGVIRDIFSQFWEEISAKKFEMSDKSVSLLPSNGPKNFVAIGKIMAKSFLESIPISIPIHSIVFRFLTNQMPKNKIEWIKSLVEFDPQIANNIDFDKPDNNELIERCKEILVTRRLKELNELKKGFFFCQQLELIIQNMFEWWTLMSEIIGDEEINAKKLVNEIKFIGLSQNSVDIWTRVIIRFNKEQTKQFLRLITGLNGMPVGGYKKRGKHLIITKSDRFFAHTCTFELESPEFSKEIILSESLSAVFASMESDYSMNEWYHF